MKLLHEPLLQFVFIGAAIYLLFALFAEPSEQQLNDTITVSAGEIEWMQNSWQKRWNRPPTTQELDGLIQQYIRETVLYREALTMGLNKHDQVIRRRLAQKLEFLAKDLVTLTPPTEEELQTYFNQHQDRYQAPIRFTFSQVFFDPDKRGDATLDDAEKIKARLIARVDALDNVGALGDGIMLQDYYPQKDLAEIQKQLGSGFAKSLSQLSSGQWHGPVLSGYGVHLVYVHNIIQPPAPLFTEARERVQQDWKTDKSDELNEKFYSNLRQRYNIVIEQAEQAEQADKVVVVETQDKELVQ